MHAPLDFSRRLSLVVSSRRGSTLVMTMCFVAIFAIIVGAAFEYTNNASRQDIRAAGYARSEAAADGYANIIYGRFCAWVVNHNNLCPGNTDISSVDRTNSRPAILDPATTIVPPAGSSLANYRMVVNSYTPKFYPVLPDDSQPATPDFPNYAEAYSSLTSANYDKRLKRYQTRAPLPFDKTKGSETYTYKLVVTVEPINPGPGDSDPVTIVRYIQETLVTPFNYARFNNGSLSDGSNGRVYTGPLYSAANITLTGNPMTINGQVNYVGSFYGKISGSTPTLNDPSNLIFPNQNVPLGSSMATASGANALKQTARIELIPNLANSLATLPDANGKLSRASTPESGSNNFSIRELIETPVSTVVDPPTVAQNRIYNMADVRIHVNGTSVTITKVDRNTLNANNDNVDVPLLATDPLYVAVKASITLKQTTDATPFYDTNLDSKSPLKTTDVNVGTISDRVAKINADNALLPNPPPPIKSIYVWDDTPSANGAVGNTPVVRLYNGGVLPPDGLSFGSDNGIYIKGDWNTGTQLSGATDFSSGTQVAGTTPPSNALDSSLSVTLGQNAASGYTVSPSGVFGDSVTQLTQSWKDANSQGTRKGVSTTMNVVFGEGSGAVNERQDNDVFTDARFASLRFLEDWNGGRRTNTGSEMQLWHSRYYTSFGVTSFNIKNKDTLFNPAVTRGLFPKWGSPLFTRGRFYRYGGTPTSAL